MVKTIESLAPGLYEMLISKEDGGFTVAFEARTIDDILKIGERPRRRGRIRCSRRILRVGDEDLRIDLAAADPGAGDAGRCRSCAGVCTRCASSTIFSRTRTPLFSNLEDLAETGPGATDTRREGQSVCLRLERLYADCVEHSWNLYRDMRDAAIELTFHALYGTPWMKRLGAARQARPQSHNISKFPHVQDAIKRAKVGGYAEGIIRMLVLLARARGSVRRDRLERSDRLLHARPPFSSMTAETRARLIYEQSLIVEFCGNEAVTSLAELLKDPVDRYRALNSGARRGGAGRRHGRRDHRHVQALPGGAIDHGA